MQCMNCGSLVEPRQNVCFNCGSSVNNSQHQKPRIIEPEKNNMQSNRSYSNDNIHRDRSGPNYRNRDQDDHLISECPRCGESLDYDRRYGDFWCYRCRNNYSVEAINSEAANNSERRQNTIEKREDHEHYSFNDYKCTECGSKLQYNDRDFMYWCDYCRRYIKSTINDPPRRSDQTSDYNENYYEESSTAGGSYKIAGGILAILGIMFGGIGYFFTTASGEELMPGFLDLVLIFILTFVFTGAGWWLYNRGLEKEYSHKYSRTPGYSY